MPPFALLALAAGVRAAEPPVIDVAPLDRFARLVGEPASLADSGRDSKELLSATRGVREALSATENRLLVVDAVLDRSLVAPLVALLGHADSAVTLESAWCLTNIASGTTAHTEAVASHDGAVPALLRLLSLRDASGARVQAAWAIANIAGDGPRLRDEMLAAGALEPVLQLIEDSLEARDAKAVGTAVWTAANLLRGRPKPAAASAAAAPTILTVLKLLSEQPCTPHARSELSPRPPRDHRARA